MNGLKLLHLVFVVVIKGLPVLYFHVFYTVGSFGFTQLLSKQVCRYHKLSKTFFRFCRRHSELDS